MNYQTKNEFLEYAINTYGDMVYRLALSRVRKKDLAEDIFQEVFLRFARKEPIFENEEHEKAYIIRLTINCSKTLLDSKYIKRVVELKDDIVFETPERNQIYYAVLELPLKYRTVIHLFYYEGYKINEISKLLNTNENTIKSQLMRAREMLKTKVEGGIEDE